MLCPEGSEGPDGCIFLLEDMKGGCARDKLGRPIIVSIGSLHGSSLEMQKQMVYAFSRAKKYYKEGTIPSHFTVVDIIPPKGTFYHYPNHYHPSCRSTNTPRDLHSVSPIGRCIDSYLLLPPLDPNNTPS